MNVGTILGGLYVSLEYYDIKLAVIRLRDLYEKLNAPDHLSLDIEDFAKIWYAKRFSLDPRQELVRPELRAESHRLHALPGLIDG